MRKISSTFDFAAMSSNEDTDCGVSSITSPTPLQDAKSHSSVSVLSRLAFPPGDVSADAGPPEVSPGRCELKDHASQKSSLCYISSEIVKLSGGKSIGASVPHFNKGHFVQCMSGFV